MTRTHRERLLKNGFIKEIMKGWYISSRPDEPAGESTAWYASFWRFCSRKCALTTHGQAKAIKFEDNDRENKFSLSDIQMKF